jgi:leader peptidase (prepilin peptidase)/N-methyltransferase
MFDPERWAGMPFLYWAVVFFTFGSIVGSFLNVCIYRLPLGQSVVWPGSHCPSCGRAIPWFLNIPLASWLWLRGRCRFCASPISARYFLVELLTGALFLACWAAFGKRSAWIALVFCLVLAGLIVATFIDFEHYIIPDEITLGGIGAGFLFSLLLPELHGADSSVVALQRCCLGMAAGGGIIYLFVRLGKLLFGQQRFNLPPASRVYFTEDALVLPSHEIPYEDIFYRKSDTIQVEASLVEMADRGYRNVAVRMTQTTLRIGPDEFATEQVPCLEVVADQIVVPREAMGLGDVKFMAAIGAFVGWKGVVFSLMASAMLGSVVGITLIALRRHAWSSRIPYGPYIALAAAVWVFFGEHFIKWWLSPLPSAFLLKWFVR